MLKLEEIHWAQQRLTKTKGLDQEGYSAWLLYERDGLSFQDVGDMLFPNDQTREGRKTKARNRWLRIEREFGRGPKRKAKPLCTADGICLECGRGSFDTSFGVGLAWFSRPTPR